MIIIPMVGKSSRFYNAGFKVPKYELKIDEYSVFYHAVNSFNEYFDSDKFLFIVRNDSNAKNYVESQIKLLKIKNYEICVLNEDTLGQADTVYQGLTNKNYKNDEQLYIFNIDTFRPGFTKTNLSKICDGYLEVFEGEGEHWSFVEPGLENKVIRTTEKNRISNLCSNGLYYFRELKCYKEAYEYALTNKKMDNNEYYIAPLYNYLILKGKDIRYYKININKVIFCGTPEEYRRIIIK